MNDDFGTAAITDQKFCVIRLTGFILENRGMAVVEAICTNIMRCCNSAFFILNRVSKSTRLKFVQFVPLFLSFPCFKASHFFFKLAYAANQRHLFRLCGEDFFLKFWHLYT